MKTQHNNPLHSMGLAHFFTIILLFSSLTTIAKNTKTELCLGHQQALLLEVRKQLVFNSSYSTKLVLWNGSDDCCRWEGVECDDIGRVVSLQLDNEGISGGLEESSSLFGLKHLEELDLSHNLLSGTIPISIFTQLPSLWLLNLSNNRFGGRLGELPVANISTRLSSLDLSRNRLEAPIPNSFFNIQSLEYLKLSHNLFNHSFQLENILGLSNLYHLDLSSNGLSLDAPTIPRNSNTTTLPALQYSLGSLDLSNNRISGELPSWIWEVGGLRYHLNLSCNMLVGLQKPHNIPPSLDVLDLHSNQLRGDLSSLLQLLTTNCNLISLDLSNNSLVGDVPFSFQNCKFITVVDLSSNELSGTVPTYLAQLEYLAVLNLGRNNFSGPIPDFNAHCRLQYLDLRSNNFTGEVPISLANCKRLEVMNVGNNHIHGTFPCMLPSSLQVLVLRSNGFRGEVRCRNKRWPNLQIIDIASNDFSGYLNPFNFSSWRGMEIGTVTNSSYKALDFTVGDSWFWGYYREEVTITIKGGVRKLVKILPDFTSIDFSNNNFHGDIPESIGALDRLYLLNLSHNSLTGTIPKSFSNLTLLGSLDLSTNRLMGEIPKEIASLSFLAAMNVSHNELVGQIPLSTQIQSFPADCFEGNLGLCGLPLNITCSNPRPIPPPNVEKEREIAWEYVFAAAGYAVGLGSFSWLLLFCRSFRYKYFDKIEDVCDKIFGRKKKHGGRRVSRK